MVPRAPLAITPPSVLRPDWKTLARLTSRWSKPPDLDVCPAPSSLRQFCGATDKSKPRQVNDSLQSNQWTDHLVSQYFFWTCFATNWESTRIRSHQMTRYLASRKPVTSPSYSAMLSVPGNSSWIAYYKISPSRNKHDTNPCSFESVEFVEVHHPMIK
jgi:hypothetical protein